MKNNLSYELNEAFGEFTQLKIAEQLDFKKLYIYSIVTHSTAIEGSTIDEVENALMFDEGIAPAGHNVTEQLMNLDLLRAYDYVERVLPQKAIITVDFLKKLSALVMRNTGSVRRTVLGDFDVSNGDLRLVNVSAGRGGKTYLDFRKVPKKLEEFCLWVNEKRRGEFLDSASVYKFSFEAHYRLVSIHPWADGNGRVSRLFMNMLQMENNILPTIIKKEDKAEYIRALSSSQDKDESADFVEFMMKSTVRFINECIKDYANGLSK